MPWRAGVPRRPRGRAGERLGTGNRAGIRHSGVRRLPYVSYDRLHASLRSACRTRLASLGALLAHVDRTGAGTRGSATAHRPRDPRQGRAHGRDAGRHQAAHGGVLTEDLPNRWRANPSAAHALWRQPVRTRHVSASRRTVTRVCRGTVDRRLPGRAGPVSVRGRVGRGASLQARQDWHGLGRVVGRLRHHRLAGEERPVQQRPRRHVGHLVPRLLCTRGADRRPSGTEGRVAAGARHRLLPERRLVSQRRLPAGAQLLVLRGLSAARPTAASSAARHRVQLRHQGWLPLLSERRVIDGDEPQVRAGQEPVLDDEPRAHHLRRFLEGSFHLAILPQRDAGGADRRRLVRRRGPQRRAAGIPRAARAEPGDREPSGDGTVDTRRLGPKRRCEDGRARLRSADVHALPERYRVPLLRAAPARRVGAGGTRCVDLRDRLEHLAHQRHMAAEGHGASLLLHWRQRPVDDGAHGQEATRRVRERPRQPGAARRRRGDRHAARLHGLGPVVRRTARRRARVPQPRARRGRHGARSHRRRPARLDDRDRFRLRGEGAR